MNDVTVEQVTARAVTDYEAARERAQAAADNDPVRQADVVAGLIQKPMIVGWDELDPAVQQGWLRESRRKLEAGQ